MHDHTEQKESLNKILFDNLGLNIAERLQMIHITDPNFVQDREIINLLIDLGTKRSWPF